MNRFLFFTCPDYYPCGGLGDVRYSSNTLEEMEIYLNTKDAYISMDEKYVWDRIEDKRYELSMNDALKWSIVK